MDVILLKDVEGLGLAGDIVNVKPGYARNYLAPLGLALRASKRNLAVADEKKNVAKARNERANKVNQELADALRVKGLPTLIIYKNGEMKWRQTGQQDANTLISLVQQYV